MIKWVFILLACFFILYLLGLNLMDPAGVSQVDRYQTLALANIMMYLGFKEILK